MTNTELLRKKIDDSGYKMAFIAEKCGLTHQGFLNKLNNKTEFTMSEACILRDILNMTSEEFEAIFFASKVE